jgi:hypothetical protein
MDELTVNENVLSSSLSCPLLSYFAMSLHTDRVRVYACVRKGRERERQSASRERRTGEDEVRGKQARARKRVKGTGHHKDGENEKKKMHYSQTDDYLTLYRWSSFGCWLVMVTTFSSLLLFLSRIAFLSRSLLRCMQHLVCPAIQRCLFFLLLPDFFSLFSFFFLCKKTNDSDTQCNNNLFSFIIIIIAVIRILRAYGTSILNVSSVHV